MSTFSDNFPGLPFLSWWRPKCTQQVAEMRTVLSGLTRIVSLAVSLNLIRAQSGKLSRDWYYENENGLLNKKITIWFDSSQEPPCSPPEPIKNGLTDWDGKSGVARYACFQGYHLVGPPRVECRYGDWYAGTPVSLPSCKPIVCNHPTIESGSLVTGESVR